LALSTPHFSTPVSSPLVGSKLLLQKPILVGVFHPPYWLFLFINNAASVVLLSLIWRAGVSAGGSVLPTTTASATLPAQRW